MTKPENRSEAREAAEGGAASTSFQGIFRDTPSQQPERGNRMHHLPVRPVQADLVVCLLSGGGTGQKQMVRFRLMKEK